MRRLWVCIVGYSEVIGAATRVLVPRWGKRIAVDIRPVEVKHWLRMLAMEDPIG
jgi:hypothetical protein